MKLKKLIKDLDLQVKGSKEVEITGICSNSQVVAPGNLFIARRGATFDGTQYIPEAIAAGAVAILTDIFDPSLKEVAQIVHPDVSKLESLFADHYYGHPSDQLFTVGVTGTSGKTTTTMLIKYLLDQLGSPCGLIGTIEHIIGSHRYSASRTTPDVIANHKMLREMILQGCRAATMEVTSHGLHQGRMDHIDYDVAIYTNLSLDHLDYHKTMEEYCHVKGRLFRELGSSKAKAKATAVVNRDDSWCSKIIEGCKAPIITYGIGVGADLYASDVVLNAHGTSFNVHYRGEKVALTWPFIGRFNVYNGLAAIAVGLIKGVPLPQITAIMANAPQVAGRLEQVDNPAGLSIFVDYAHKPDALKNVLECLREVSKGRIITVFGCGGDRDRSKRPLMAQVSESLSDYTIVTSDNPRTENPVAIVEEIIQGYKDKSRYFVELDRRLAIAKALEVARPGDTILIAGKGHETSQTFLHHTVPFDDRLVVKELCWRAGSLKD